METYTYPTTTFTAAKADVLKDNLIERIIEYYEDAGPDYKIWSKDFNMHFGYGNWFKIFKREEMLHNMNKEIFDRLKINAFDHKKIIDLGCGLGASMRSGVRKFPGNKFTGVTIVPWQVEAGTEMTLHAGMSEEIKILNNDYTQLNFENASFDAAYALESACHSPGTAKPAFVKDLSRVLKKGGRFVIADGFLIKGEKELSPLVNRMYKSICKNWALPSMANLDAFVQMLKNEGLTNIKVEDISWKVAPSVVHVPLVIARFLIGKFLRGEEIKRQSINNLKGSFMALTLGLCRSSFGYYIISGEKR